MLVLNGPTKGTGYRAFDAALRGLPQQQAEAFLLHHGERLNERHLGVAMDCSASAAAAEHLRAAEQTLAGLAGAQFDQQTGALRSVYATLAPDDAEIGLTVRRHVRQLRRRKRWRKVVILGFVLLLFGLATATYVVFTWK